jgi:hypothetical protein
VDFKEIAWESVDWIYLAQARDQGPDLVNMVTILPVLKILGTS